MAGRDRRRDRGRVPDKEELTTRSWQRAGALVRFFNPFTLATVRTGLAVPGAVFAAPPTDTNPSKRPLRTVEPLVADLGLVVGIEFALYCGTRSRCRSACDGGNGADLLAPRAHPETRGDARHRRRRMAGCSVRP